MSGTDASAAALSSSSPRAKLAEALEIDAQLQQNRQEQQQGQDGGDGDGLTAKQSPAELAKEVAVKGMGEEEVARLREAIQDNVEDRKFLEGIQETRPEVLLSYLVPRCALSPPLSPLSSSNSLSLSLSLSPALTLSLSLFSVAAVWLVEPRI